MSNLKLGVLLVFLGAGFFGVSCSSMEPDGATKILSDMAGGGAGPLDGPEVRGSAPDMSNRAGAVQPGGPVRWKMQF